MVENAQKGIFFGDSARSPHRTDKPSRGCLPLAHPRALPAVVNSDRRSPSAMCESPFEWWGVCAVPQISRTARRMAHDVAHDLLCAALLLLLGCLRPARAARLAIAALGICRASYLGLLLHVLLGARRRLLVLINGRTGLFEQPAHSPESEPGRFQAPGAGFCPSSDFSGSCPPPP